VDRQGDIQENQRGGGKEREVQKNCPPKRALKKNMTSERTSTGGRRVGGDGKKGSGKL